MTSMRVNDREQTLTLSFNNLPDGAEVFIEEDNNVSLEGGWPQEFSLTKAVMLKGRYPVQNNSATISVLAE